MNFRTFFLVPMFAVHVHGELFELPILVWLSHRSLNGEKRHIWLLPARVHGFDRFSILGGL